MFTKNITISHTVAAFFENVAKYNMFSGAFMNYSDVLETSQ